MNVLAHHAAQACQGRERQVARSQVNDTVRRLRWLERHARSRAQHLHGRVTVPTSSRTHSCDDLVA
ncbi:MAG: hypothetical protein IPF87_14025 [Gemmatimonadetes bacterium]|nr:hypothetical protein [Gemmatimonadota bacterium]